MHMKKSIGSFSIVLGCVLSSVIIGVNLVNSGHISFDKNLDAVVAEAAGISGKVEINGVSYKWAETSWSKNRGMTFNPGNHVYQFLPNPHDDPWYNKNQNKFYKLAADQIKKQGDDSKWDQKVWPDSIKVSINGVSYTLKPR